MSFSTEQFTGWVKKNPISITCGILSVALLVSAYIRSDEQEKALTELETKSAEADRLALNLRNAAQLKDHVDALVSAGKEIDARMIRAGQLTTNRQYFYKLESETGVKLLELRLAPTSAAKRDMKGASYLPTAFSLNVQGDYKQLLAFLRQLENGTHYCRLLGATLNTPPERGAVLVLNLNLELLSIP